ncbi:hypothetical protein DL96DRAFT_1594684 [Flagelloscypha sp. PMI_526]|nr:hypothetical protein DL96DRAFT_1594684 [Flagelloscypha sp. PMI_526]
MSESPNKRLIRESDASFTDFNSPVDDLAARIRAASSRGRKTVTEGYKSPPTQTTFTKAHSTGQLIFQSSRDAQQAALHSVSTSPSLMTISSEKKRSRDTPEDDLPPSSTIDSSSSQSASSSNSSSGSHSDVSLRPIKPLRKAFGRTAQSTPALGLPKQANSAVAEETSEDWSFNNSTGSSPFQPMEISD